MSFTRLVENVSKKQVPAHVAFFIVEVMACDDEGEDVEVLCLFPYPLAVVLTFRTAASVHYHPSQVVSKRAVERGVCLVECIRRGMCNMLIVRSTLHRGCDCQEWSVVPGCSSSRPIIWYRISKRHLLRTKAEVREFATTIPLYIRQLYILCDVVQEWFSAWVSAYRLQSLWVETSLDPLIT